MLLSKYKPVKSLSRITNKKYARSQTRNIASCLTAGNTQNIPTDFELSQKAPSNNVSTIQTAKSTTRSKPNPLNSTFFCQQVNSTLPIAFETNESFAETASMH